MSKPRFNEALYRKVLRARIDSGLPVTNASHASACNENVSCGSKISILGFLLSAVVAVTYIVFALMLLLPAVIIGTSYTVYNELKKLSYK